MTDRGILASFSAAYRRSATGVWSAPGRVNLIGEHTDYNLGFVFPFAIDRRTTLALAPRDDRVLRVGSTFSPDTVSISLNDLAPDRLHGWSAYPLGVAWALGQVSQLRGVRTGVDVFFDSDVPVGAGLSSSAAIESAMAVALNDVWRLDLDRRTLAKAGQLAENRAVGAPTGIMDQSASLLGRSDSGVFLDCRSLAAEVIPLGFDSAGLEVLVIDTRVSHAHSSGGYAARRASCEEGARILKADSLRDVQLSDLPEAAELLDGETFRRVRHVVTENQRVLDTVRTLREKGPRAIGPLLDASHVSMRDDFEISSPELDLAVSSAAESGAIGARMTGGGFGGAAIALVDRADTATVRDAVAAAFDRAGYRAPDIFTVRAAQGAGREQ